MKKTNFYNLDAIISVGYRVNSAKTTKFRIWATKVLKEFMQKGFVLDDERLKQGRISVGQAVVQIGKRDNVYLPLCDTASNKICRATHEDLMSKVQVNLYVSGLHKIGSQSIHRYTKLEMGDLLALTSVAFGQPLYKVDKDLNIIDD